MGVETLILGPEHSLPWEDLRLKTTRGWPTRMKGDLCWTSDTFQRDEDYALVLGEVEVSEVEAALARFPGMCKPAHDLIQFTAC